MKPLNEKERTMAFIKFLVLFILTVILTIFIVFGDFNMGRKEYDELKKENKELRENQSFSSDIPVQIDSLRKVINSFKQLSPVDYEQKSRRLNVELTTNISLIKEDSTNLAKTKSEIWKVFMDWTDDVGGTLRENSKIEQIKDLNLKLTKSEEEYKQLDKDYKAYQKEH